MIKQDWWRPHWQLPANVQVAISTRMGGVSDGKYASMNLSHMVGDADDAVGENRARFGASLPGKPALAWLTQVHGTKVLPAAEVIAVDEPPEADACWTDRQGQACVVTTADCVPVLLAAVDGSSVVAIHAGWRGLAARIIATSVAALGTIELTACIGPCIGQANYQVGAEVVTALRAAGAENDCFQAASEGKFLLNLIAATKSQLRAAGIESIISVDICNYLDRRNYFSARRDSKASGRFASAIWISS